MNQYTITVDYGATGEGRTLIIYYVFAQDKEAALHRFRLAFQGGDWFVQGANIVDGFDFISDIPNLMISEAVRNQLEDPKCNRHYLGIMHVNYS